VNASFVQTEQMINAVAERVEELNRKFDLKFDQMSTDIEALKKSLAAVKKSLVARLEKIEAPRATAPCAPAAPAPAPARAPASTPAPSPTPTPTHAFFSSPAPLSALAPILPRRHSVGSSRKS
jgi:hypothetical protein